MGLSVALSSAVLVWRGDASVNRRFLRLMTIALVVLGLGLAISFAEKINRERFASAERAEVLYSLTIVRDALEGNLNSDIQLVRGLIAVVALVPDPGQKRFEMAVQPLFSGRT